MIRSCSLAALLLTVTATSAGASVDVGPNESKDSIVIWARDEFRGGNTDTPSPSDEPDPWELYEACLAAVAESVLRWKCLEPLDFSHDTPGGIAPGHIEEAVRSVGLPGLRVVTQPATSTLVNVATIFYTTPTPVSMTIPILGNLVRIRATATSYTWNFGDGTVRTTTHPGAAYPHETVTHTYQHTSEATAVTLRVGYHVRYSFDGNVWLDLSEPIGADGPPSTLRITEARAVLVAP